MLWRLQILLHSSEECYICLFVCFNKPSTWLDSNFKLCLLSGTQTSVLLFQLESVLHTHGSEVRPKFGKSFYTEFGVLPVSLSFLEFPLHFPAAGLVLFSVCQLLRLERLQTFCWGFSHHQTISTMAYPQAKIHKDSKFTLFPSSKCQCPSRILQGIFVLFLLRFSLPIAYRSLFLYIFWRFHYYIQEGWVWCEVADHLYFLFKF